MRRAVCESQKTITRKKKADYPDEADANSDLIHMVPLNKRNHNRRNGKKQKHNIYSGTQSSYVLYKKVVYPERRYKSYSSQQRNSFGSYKNKKELYGRISKSNATLKQFSNTKKKIQKQMKALKKQNKILFKLANNNRNRRQLENQ